MRASRRLTLIDYPRERLLPIYDSLTKIAGKEGPTRDLINGALEIAPLVYMRGRTFDRSVILLDEAQNCSIEQLKMLVTRLGEESKIITTGDPEQSDLPPHKRDDFARFVDRVASVDRVGVVEFDASGIVRHQIIGVLLAALN